jgi:cytochrome bd-type quinol oxidase subunit 2
MYEKKNKKRKEVDQMIQKIKKAFYAVSSTVLILPAAVLAQGYAPPQAPGGVPTATSASDLILKVINWILAFIGSLAVLMIVVAGVMYITSGGDEGRVDKAKSFLTYSIVGLVVALLGYVIVLTVGNALK